MNACIKSIRNRNDLGFPIYIFCADIVVIRVVFIVGAGALWAGYVGVVRNISFNVNAYSHILK